MSTADPEGASSGPSIRQAIKRALDLCCAIVVAPAAAMCALEAAVSEAATSVFVFWAQTFALVPGPAGRVTCAARSIV